MNFLTIKEEILATGSKLVDKGSEAGPRLRELQGNLSNLKDTDLQTKFLSYFLFLFIDDLYYNLSGDFPYHEKTNQIINDIFKGIGNHLIELSKSIDSDFTKSYNAYMNMVDGYLNGLNQIESHKDDSE